MQRRSTVALVVLAVVVAGIAAVAAFRPGRAAQVAAGLVAHNLCSAVFTSKLDPDMMLHDHLRPLLGDLATQLTRYRVDREAHAVTATFAGLVTQRASFVAGHGCRLDHPDNAAAPEPRIAADTTAVDDFAPAEPVVATDARIAAAIDRVFADDPAAAAKSVKAVVIVKDGRVVAERYAPGVTAATPMLSWSVAKSFTNALLAVLVRDGRLRVDQPVAAPEWPAGDPRGRITLEDLLRMQSGLDAPEEGSPFDPVAQMEYTQADMAGYAARRPVKETPATRWEYTSANTILLDRVLGATVGQGAAGLRDFAERELFAPLGMKSVTMEFDGAGTFQGSSHVYATARDYARFGWLYANDGVAPGGRRILPEGWVVWSRKATLGTVYGAGFFTNDGPDELAARRVAAGFPQDGFFASGNQGQRIYIVPSRKVVIVRLGYSQPPTFGILDDIELVAAVCEKR